jgi:ubiquinone/menaquinone biosynthesis C-methylase UbiE
MTTLLQFRDKAARVFYQDEDFMGKIVDKSTCAGLNLREAVCFTLSKLCFKLKPPVPLGSNPEYFECERRDIDGFNRKFESSLVFSDKKVLDVGCGLGGQTVGFSLKGADIAVGLDMNRKWIETAVACTKQKKSSERVHFILGDAKYLPIKKDFFDIINIHDAVEHLPETPHCLRECKRVLKPGGLLLVSFAPWHSVYGAHSYNYVPIPWCHSLFSDETLVNVARKTSLLPKSEVEQEIAQFYGLSKMTAGKFKNILATVRFQTVFYKEKFIRNMSLFKFYPSFLQEFFIGEIACILRKPD